MKRHVHSFRIMAFLDPGVFEWCDCGTQRIRKTGSVERRALRAQYGNIVAESRRIHRVNWGFNKNFRKGKEWRWTGPELMDRIEVWARRQRRDVFVSEIADRTFGRAILLFILHRDGRRLWGVSLVGVTADDASCELFLYPDQAFALGSVFRSLKKYRSFKTPGGDAVRRICGTLKSR